MHNSLLIEIVIYLMFNNFINKSKTVVSKKYYVKCYELSVVFRVILVSDFIPP